MRKLSLLPVLRIAILGLIGTTLIPLTLRADNVDTGASTQSFVLTGQGPLMSGGNTFGTYVVQQGSCATAGATTTCTLSGALASGGSPGFTSGTYSFVTTFSSSDVDPITAESEGPDPGALANNFVYSFLAPDVAMVLNLFTSGGNYVVPLVTGGNFDGPGFSFGYTGTEICSGVVTCSQANVGLVDGATISGPVDIAASFSSSQIQPAPEPSSGLLVLTALLVGGITFLGKNRRRNSLC